MRKIRHIFTSGNEDNTGPDGNDESFSHFKAQKQNKMKGNVEDVIIQKLKKGNRQAGNLPENELRDWARSLCVKQDLVDVYLNPDFAHTITMFNSLNEQQQKFNAESSQQESGGIMASVASGSEGPMHVPEELEDTDFEIDELMKENEKPQYTLGKHVKVKLVIGEICKSDAQKTVRRMLSPVLTRFDPDNNRQFGMFHSAIVIGPWYIEWNNSSLCIPRKCYSGAALLAADLSVANNKKFDLNDAIDKVADVIIDWNLTHHYNQTHSNCQVFVDDVCKALGVDLSHFDGPLGDTIKRLRQKGVCEVNYNIPAEMREKFAIKDSKLEFDSHRQLDEFVEKLNNKDPRFEFNYPHDWMLLKSFDRAFWLRHYKMPDDDRFKPLERCIEEEVEGGNFSYDDDPMEQRECPFKDPQVTMSFKKDWF
eukprot:gb/GECH01006796.1/.p1 GENE.gb/GECH01006796.1/~~gb/GECH01006796.1/.p1  ORF type:complete len:423 (+),score=90.25 gb/GECH01006796.1/:1-1269(+)